MLLILDKDIDNIDLINHQNNLIELTGTIFKKYLIDLDINYYVYLEKIEKDDCEFSLVGKSEIIDIIFIQKELNIDLFVELKNRVAELIKDTPTNISHISFDEWISKDKSKTNMDENIQDLKDGNDIEKEEQYSIKDMFELLSEVNENVKKLDEKVSKLTEPTRIKFG